MKAAGIACGAGIAFLAVCGVAEAGSLRASHLRVSPTVWPADSLTVEFSLRNAGGGFGPSTSGSQDSLTGASSRFEIIVLTREPEAVWKSEWMYAPSLHPGEKASIACVIRPFAADVRHHARVDVGVVDGDGRILRWQTLRPNSAPPSYSSPAVSPFVATLDDSPESFFTPTLDDGRAMTSMEGPRALPRGSWTAIKLRYLIPPSGSAEDIGDAARIVPAKSSVSVPDSSQAGAGSRRVGQLPQRRHLIDPWGRAQAGSGQVPRP